MYEEAYEAIREALRSSTQPALLYSGGKESSILLDMLDRMGSEAARVPLICFYDEWPPVKDRLRYVEEVFKRNSRILLNFRPLHRFLVPSDEGIDLVNAYDLRGTTLPVLQSPYDGGGQNLPCALYWMNLPVKDCPDFPFDLLLCGGRREDHHLHFGSPYVSPIMKVGDVGLLLPLLEWSEQAVWKTICERGIGYDVDRYDFESKLHVDEVEMCTRCLRHNAEPFWCSALQERINPPDGATGGPGDQPEPPV